MRVRAVIEMEVLQEALEDAEVIDLVNSELEADWNPDGEGRTMESADGEFATATYPEIVSVERLQMCDVCRDPENYEEADWVCIKCQRWTGECCRSDHARRLCKECAK